MVRGLLVAGLVCWSTSAAFAGHRPGSGPPAQQIVRVDSTGQLQVYYQVTVCMPETRTRTVQRQVPVTKEVQEEVNGEIRTRKVTEYVTQQQEQSYTVMNPHQETKVRAVDPSKAKAYETDGKPIPLKKLKDRLAEDTLVVVSANDQMIPDYYAGLFKPGTIILAFEPEPMIHQAMPAPAPPANAAPRPPQAGMMPPAIRFISQPKENDEDAVELRVPDSTPGPIFPRTLPPMFVFASREGTEQFKVRRMTENSFDVTGHKVKQKGTGKQMVPVQLTQTVRQNEITTIFGKDLQFFAGDGATLSAERIKEKLSREGTVAYSADGEPVDPFWLQNFKPTTLILVGPQLPGGCGGPMMGYGVPCAPAAPAQIESPPPPPPQAAPPVPQEAPQPNDPSKT